MLIAIHLANCSTFYDIVPKQNIYRNTERKVFIRLKFSDFKNKANCIQEELQKHNRTVYHFKCKNVYTEDIIKRYNPSFYAVKCSSVHKTRTENRFFVDKNNEKIVYHTQITVACTNETKRSLYQKSDDQLKKDVESQIRPKTNRAPPGVKYLKFSEFWEKFNCTIELESPITDQREKNLFNLFCDFNKLNKMNERKEIIPLQTENLDNIGRKAEIYNFAFPICVKGYRLQLKYFYFYERKRNTNDRKLFLAKIPYKCQ